MTGVGARASRSFYQRQAGTVGQHFFTPKARDAVRDLSLRGGGAVTSLQGFNMGTGASVSLKNREITRGVPARIAKRKPQQTADPVVFSNDAGH